MGLKTPRLDDRSFNDLVEEARARIPLYTPEWTDHNLSDPGITLLELFAWMTDIVLYRLNRVPDKHFVKFMELIGIQLAEAVPAKVDVTFWLSAPQLVSILIPGSTEVSTTRTETNEAIIFTSDADAEIKVPELDHVLTSFATDEGTRSFIDHDIAALQAGYQSFPIFPSDPPRVGDSLYLGFENNISHQVIALNLNLSQAEGSGINPLNPPYIWEVLRNDGSGQWRVVDVEYDTTKGLNDSGSVRLFLPEMTVSSRNDVSSYWLRCSLIVGQDTETKYAVSPQLNQLSVQGWGVTIPCTNVSRVKSEVVGRSDGTPGQRFYLEHTPIIARTADEILTVRLEDGREQHWEEVHDFSDSKGNDRHYVLDSHNGEVRFGPALPQADGNIRRYGALPPKGSLLIMNAYRYGGGQVGNVTSQRINILKTSIPYIARVLNRYPAVGGQDAESLENAKERVPGYLRSLQRAVTASDFEFLAQEAVPGKVGRVYCLQPPLTNRGENKVLVIPQIPLLYGFISPESLELSSDVRQTIQQYLDERRLLSTQLEVMQPAYLWAETRVTVSLAEHYRADKVSKAIEEKLFQFINPVTGGFDGKGWEFGRDLMNSDVIAVLSSVEGVNFVREVQIFPVTYENRQFKRGEKVTQIAVPSHGVVVSYQHTVITE